ncbi:MULTISPECIES: hypothetical protein [unclassified Moorena]|nr:MULTISPECIES: hypothetical protein [unclassified Moorena]
MIKHLKNLSKATKSETQHQFSLLGFAKALPNLQDYAIALVSRVC